MLSPIAYIQALKRGDNPSSIAGEILFDAITAPLPPKSLMDCHTPGVDSIVLYDGDDGMIRFFVAHEFCHGLGHLYNEEGHFTIGVHNHKYEIAKIALDNPFINVTTRCVPPSYDGPKQSMYEYGFRSALKTGEIGVERYGLLDVAAMEPDLILPGQCVVMDPSDLHTVMASGGFTTSWMVIEGPEVVIDPLIYSPRDDLALSKVGLYRPMNEDQARRAILGLLKRITIR